jgi:hypothetical protein
LVGASGGTYLEGDGGVEYKGYNIPQLLPGQRVALLEDKIQVGTGSTMDKPKKVHTPTGGSSAKRRKDVEPCLFEDDECSDIINMTMALMQASISIESSENILATKPPIRADVFVREQELDDRVTKYFYPVPFPKE